MFRSLRSRPPIAFLRPFLLTEVCLALGAGLTAGSVLNGPAKCEALAYYIVHTGGPLSLQFTASETDRELRNHGGVRLPHTVFWQFYDADEHLVTADYHRFGPEDDSAKVFSIPATDRSPGIYQLRYAFSAGSGLTADLRTEPPTAWGVMPCRARMSGIAEAWVYVPSDTTAITIPTYATAVTISDEQGELLGKSTDKAAVPVAPGSVIRITVTSPSGHFGIRGLPSILCPDKATALAIHGSIETTPDGAHFAHKFQARMRQWMQDVRPEDLAVEPVDLVSLETEWLKDPRNVGLLGTSGPFSHVRRILHDQILDRKNPDYGLGINTSWLGVIYLLDKPLNPYRKNSAILKRLLLHEFARFLKLTENGTFRGDNWDHYAGVDALSYRQRIFQFGTVAPHLDDNLRTLWSEAALRVLNTMGLRRVSAENQTSHWLLDHYLAAKGSGHDVYRRIAHDFAVALEDPALNTFMQTGYQQEAYGPDATYQGLCAAQQAIYFKYTRDEVVRDGLRRIYSLFNHTVAPEPDGKMYGSSNFSHRTQGSWVHKQYNAGVRLMADELPEAAVWYQNHAPEEARLKALDDIRRELRTSRDDDWYAKNMRWLGTYAYHPWLAYFHTYVFPSQDVLESGWPAVSEERFLRNVNNEFIFIRQPSYYAAVYTGQTAHDWVRARVQTNRLPEGWVEENGRLNPTTVAAKKNKWCQSQGLSMFWTPQFGNLILGKNWNVFTAQMTRADLPGSTVAWPDYWSLEQEIENEGRCILQKLTLFNQPVSIRREVLLGPDEVGLRITVTPEENWQAAHLVEQFPILMKEGLTVQFETPAGYVSASSADTVNGVSAVRFLNERTKAGVDLCLTTASQVRLGPISHSCGQDIQTLEITFPHFTPNAPLPSELTLEISLKPEREPLR